MSCTYVYCHTCKQFWWYFFLWQKAFFIEPPSSCSCACGWACELTNAVVCGGEWFCEEEETSTSWYSTEWFWWFDYNKSYSFLACTYILNKHKRSRVWFPVYDVKMSVQKLSITAFTFFFSFPEIMRRSLNFFGLNFESSKCTKI